MRDVLFAGEVYFLGFVIAMLIAAVIKGMLAVIRRVAPEKEASEDGKPGSGEGGAA
jgi:Na+-transporting methylmalonyl-CoA/oxaloacetate decarboxylase gamma subunit